LFNLSEDLIEDNFVLAGGLGTYTRTNNVLLYDASDNDINAPVNDVVNNSNSGFINWDTSTTPFTDNAGNVSGYTYTAPLSSYYKIRLQGFGDIQTTTAGGAEWVTTNINGGGTETQGCPANNIDIRCFILVNGTTRHDF